ncbi:translation initiation factor IF-2-like [Canis lupus familiaris]|uniref:translation initiation factor IF-2-like n=1 Tax=Canis lupus familiaris TaxID=9615 RepID=UPI000DC6A952|nr:translation initiation factor IF-2-like [Canis lupus familiaris]XP_038287576.1 translation initiation factor IF-2-like [Canis lupus familiaris]XP_038427265.1 translation initiation factor IF-2-like [Canis lupus familiaris]
MAEGEGGGPRGFQSRRGAKTRIDRDRRARRGLRGSRVRSRAPEAGAGGRRDRRLHVGGPEPRASVRSQAAVVCAAFPRAPTRAHGAGPPPPRARLAPGARGAEEAAPRGRWGGARLRRGWARGRGRGEPRGPGPRPPQPRSGAPRGGGAGGGEVPAAGRTAVLARVSVLGLKGKGGPFKGTGRAETFAGSNPCEGCGRGAVGVAGRGQVS